MANYKIRVITAVFCSHSPPWLPVMIFRYLDSGFNVNSGDDGHIVCRIYLVGKNFLEHMDRHRWAKENVAVYVYCYFVLIFFLFFEVMYAVQYCIIGKLINMFLDQLQKK